MDEELIEYLVSIGALEFIFVDENGENIYKLTPEAKDLIPNLYEEHIKDFNAQVFSIWNKGAIDLSFDEDGDPLIAINENSYNEEILSTLDKKEKEILKEIIYVWDKKQSQGQ